MATFRCVTSGNCVTFTLPYDIDSMRKHPGYIRIDVEPDESEPEPDPEFEAIPQLIPPKRGRPKKGV